MSERRYKESWPHVTSYIRVKETKRQGRIAHHLHRNPCSHATVPHIVALPGFSFHAAKIRSLSEICKFLANFFILHHFYASPRRCSPKSVKTLLSSLSNSKNLKLVSYFYPRQPLFWLCRGLFHVFSVPLPNELKKTKKMNGC